MFITDHFSGNFGAGGFTILAHAGLDPSRTTNTKTAMAHASVGTPVPKCQLDIAFSLVPFRWERSGTAIKGSCPRSSAHYGRAWSSLSVRASDGIRNGLMPFQVHLSRSLGTLAVSGLCSSRGVVSLCLFQAIEHQTECL